LRFLLPMWPAMLLAAALLLRRLADFGWPGRAASTAVFLGTLAFCGYTVYDKGVLGFRDGERRYATVARAVASLTDANSIVLAMQHSGSLRYYAGRMTLRYDWLPDNSLDDVLAWWQQHGVHPYILLEPFEFAQFRAKFASASRVGQLDTPPAMI